MSIITEMSELILSNHILFDVDQNPYIYQGLSGVITSLDPISFEIIKCMKPNEPMTRERILCSLAAEIGGDQDQIFTALEELVVSGVLYEQGERMDSFVKTTKVPIAQDLPIATLVFHMINSCNLGCGYCYAGSGEYGVPQKIMTKQTATDAIDFLIRESRHINEVSVILFGGEPFMNWTQLKHTVLYGEQAAAAAGKKINFSLTTNGTLLNQERIEFIRDHRIGVSVSMDGEQEVQDKWRKFQNGDGTYELVSKNVKKLVDENKKGKPVSARVTLTKDFPEVKSTMEHLLGLGFHEVGFAPVTETDEIMMLARPEMARLLDEFEDMAELLIQKAKKNEFFGFSNLINLLAELHTGQTKAYACGAGLGFMAVSPSGELYLCHRFNEDPEVRLGDIYSGINRLAQQKLLEELHVDQKTTCSKCALKHSCAGGCYFEARERQGEITAPNLHYCSWMLRWTLIGLKTYVRLMKVNPNYMDRLVGSGECTANNA